MKIPVDCLDIELEVNCGICVYYSSGKCHVLPPTHKGFPAVSEDDCCGLVRPRVEEQGPKTKGETVTFGG